MTVWWQRYLVVGVAVVVGLALLPAGPGRDALQTIASIAFTAAMVAGVRLNRPPHAAIWYVLAAGLAFWTLGDGLYAAAWHLDPTGVPRWFADLPHFVSYALMGASLLLMSRTRGGERRPTATLDTVILTLGLGLVCWVFLVVPTWAETAVPLLDRVANVGYHVGDVLLFGALVRLATAPGSGRAALRLIAVGNGLGLAGQSLIEAWTGAAAGGAPSYELNPWWLVPWVFAGIVTLHPAMRGLTAISADRDEAEPTSQVVLLALAVLVGPAIVGGQLIAGVPLDAGPVVVVSGILIALIGLRMVGMLHRLQEQSERLGRLADIDFVTGLANRRRFTGRLRALLGLPRRSAGILLIDLDRFTEMNDTLGDQTGDAILQAVGARLLELAPPPALVARLGSHGFGVLDPAITSGDLAEATAVRLRAAVEAPLELPELTVSVGVSIGIVVVPDDGAQPTLALEHARVALELAKTRTVRTARYSSARLSGGPLASQLLGELGAAIAQGEIVLHYQPQVCVRTGRVLGVEALARWQHPRHGLLGPDLFVAAAEQTGLIAPFTQFVLDSAIAQAGRWRRDGLDLTVAVNLSARNLLDPGLADDVQSALTRHGVDAGSLELELTESSAMVDPRRSVQVLGELAAMGVTLSIDDYGTGHSSLAYLQQLPVGRLKIDRSFVTGMIGDHASAVIVHSTIELARRLELDVVAEGVEDDATLLELRALGCPVAQGYGLGRPAAGALIPALVDRIEHRLPGVLGTASLDGARGSATAAAATG